MNALNSPDLSVLDPFVPNRLYTYAEIRVLSGGRSTQAYLMSDGKSIVAGCFRKDLNPDTPHRVYPGYGKIIQSSAQRAARQEAPVPPQAV